MDSEKGNRVFARGAQCAPPPWFLEPKKSLVWIELNADFEKKSIKKHYCALFEHYFHFCKQEWLEKGWFSGENLKLAERLQLLPVKSHFRLKFCAQPLEGPLNHCCWWKFVVGSNTFTQRNGKSKEQERNPLVLSTETPGRCQVGDSYQAMSTTARNNWKSANKCNT